MQCKTCGTQFPDQMIQCPNCGTPVMQDGRQMNQGNQFNNQMNQGNQFNNQMNQGNQFNNQMNQGNQFNNQMNQGNQFNNQMNQGNQFNNNPYTNGNLNQPYNNSSMGQQGPYMKSQEEMMKEQRKEFFKSQECNSARHLITAAAVMLYISAIITFFVAIFYSNYLQVLDVIVLASMGILLQVLKSRVVSIVCGVYSMANVIYLLILTHTFSGWLILIAAVCAIIGTFSLHSNWDKHCKASAMPQAY